MFKILQSQKIHDILILIRKCSDVKNECFLLSKVFSTFQKWTKKMSKIAWPKILLGKNSMFFDIH